MPRTRIAPTPSGYLHEGNCINFLLTDWLAAATGARMQLRIDDIDADRYRREYVDDVFRILDWLGIAWDAGPRSPEDFEESHSLRTRADYYLREVRRAQDNGLETYACVCSRTQLRAAGSMTCVSSCAARGVTWRPGESALRARIPVGTSVVIGSATVDLARQLGDFVLVRRDGQPSYQVASLIEDRDAGTTHIVRGADLIASSAAQIHLAAAFAATAFTGVDFRHHALVSDQAGNKLSKSQLATGPLPLTAGLRSRLIDRAGELGEPIDIARPR